MWRTVVNRISQWPTFILLSLAFIPYLAQWFAYDFLNDDAFISFRYSYNWAHFGEIVYNLGDRVEGFTNFLWVAIGAFVIWLGGDLPLWANRISFILGLITLWQIWQKYDQMPIALSKSRWLALLLLSFSPAYACWSSGGLETLLFSTCLTMAWLNLLGTLGEVSSDRSSSHRLIVSSGISFALAAMSRPEGLVFWGISVVYLVFRSFLCTDGSDRQIARRQVFIFSSSFLLIFVPYFIWRYQYYGYPFPNTYYVKVGAVGAWQPGLLYLADWFLVQPWVLIALLTLTYQWFKGFSKIENLAKPLTLAMMYIIFLCVHVVKVGGDFMALHRFFVPIMPLMAYFFAPYVLAFYDQIKVNRPHHLVLKPFFIPILLIIMSLHVTYVYQDAMVVGSKRGVDSIGWLKQFAIQCSEIGKWIDQNTPPQTKLATTAAGALPFYAKRETIDLLGLNDEWIAHEVKPHGTRPGHTKSAPFMYPIQKGVNYLIYHPHIADRASQAHPQYLKMLKPHGFEWKNIKVPQMQPQWWGVFYRPIHKNSLKP